MRTFIVLEIRIGSPEPFGPKGELTDSWRRLAETRLASGRTETWSARLDTPA